MNKYLKSFLIASTIFLAVGSYKIWTSNQPLEDQVIHVNNHLSVQYENNSNNSNKFRYKYELQYTPANQDVQDSLNHEESLMILNNGKEEVSKLFPSDNHESVVPDISNHFVLKPGQVIDDEFSIELIAINKNIDKIKFDTKIILEELKDNKWSPVYQVIYMERGPYKSLDKGPIEFINPE